jgi:hypothetical protein
VEGSDPSAAARAPAWSGALAPPMLIAYACAVASLAILGAKFVLAARINVNWDEFYFLSHVYALARGELALFLQGAYAHAFTWIAATGGNEVDQVVRLRIVMCALLAASAGLVYGIARLWTSRPAALVAVLAFLSTWPVIKHGASFRADALLLPLTLAAFWVILRDARGTVRTKAIAGIYIGIAFVVTIKVVLLLPALALMVTLPDAMRGQPGTGRLAAGLRKLVPIFAVAGLVAAILLAWHKAELTMPTGPVGSYAAGVLETAILDMPFAPRRDYLIVLASEDALYWLAMLAGLLVAVRRRSYAAAASALALAPVLFYRNAFPYYYPVMLAPPALLVAFAADGLLSVSSVRWRRLAVVGVALACLSWAAGARDDVLTLRFDGQSGQRAIVAAVHRVFPEPVPYVDHSGMIASFPKVNFFMSTWGVENYLRRGDVFMRAAIEDRCPPLVLVDHPVLIPGTLLYRRLHEADRQLLETRYVDYWGPIRVAGRSFRIAPGAQAIVRVPCTGAYRLAAPAGIVIDGTAHSAGDVVRLLGERDYHVESADLAAGSGALIWAAARPPPANPPPAPGLYDAL